MGYRVHGDSVREFLSITGADSEEVSVLGTAADSCDNEMLRLSVALKTLTDELDNLPRRLVVMNHEDLDRANVFQAVSFHEIVGATAAYREARKTLARLARSLLVEEVWGPMLASLQHDISVRPPPGPDWEVLRKRDLGHLDA